MVLLLMAPFVPVATAQPSTGPNITLTSQYMLNGFGFVVLNETVTFSNNATGSVQIPTVHLGLPDSVVSHSPGFVLSSNDKYSLSSSNSGNVTTFTISPQSPTLAAGASSSVSVKGYVSGLLDIVPGVSTNATALLMLSPSLDQKVVTLNEDVLVPSGGTIKPIPTGFISAPASNSEIYAVTNSNVTPAIQLDNVTFADTTQSAWTPIQLYSIIRTIVASSNGVPQVQDRVSLRNLASYSITSLPVKTLAGVTNVTILPSSSVPTINPTPVSLATGDLNIANAPFSSQIKAGDNFTFTMSYLLPKSTIATSGSTVSVTIPYILTVQAIAQNYTVALALPSGMHAVGQSKVVIANATSLLQGTVSLKYGISPGWGADQAVPAAALVFAASFIVLAFAGAQTVSKKKEEEDEDDEVLGERLSDLIKALEEKISLFQQFQEDVSKKTQGTVTRADFNKIKNELDALKARATGRLNAVRQVAESQRYLDLLNQLQDAEREEDRATKDLINLYDQYHSKRMREETFRRLLPNYRKRVDSATNHLSDLLNLAQREGKQA
jgi:hypothetical protein